jgi:hypothetical protein
LLLYGSKYWTSKKEQTGRMETAEIRFIRTVAGKRITGHKSNEDIHKMENLEWKSES